MGASNGKRGMEHARDKGVIGFWVDKTRYRVVEVATGKDYVWSILGTPEEMRDPVFLQEITQWARESQARAWKKAQPKVPHTVEQRKELGHIMKDIKSSHDYARENLHGRYW